MPSDSVLFVEGTTMPSHLCGNGGSVNGEVWDHNDDRRGASRVMRAAEAFARGSGQRSTFSDHLARTRPVPTTAGRTRTVSDR